MSTAAAMPDPAAREAPLRVPLLTACAVGVAFLALAETGKHYTLVGLLGAALAATYVLPWRLAMKSWATWLIRLMGYVALIAWNLAEPTMTAGHGFYDPSAVQVAGQLLGFEIVVQAWRERPSGGRGGFAYLAASGYVFLVACNSFETHIRYYAPPYMLFLMLAVIYARAGLQPRPGPRPAWWRDPAHWARIGLLLLAMGLGLGGAYGLWWYRGDLNRMVRDLGAALRGQTSVGFSGQPQLRRGISMGRSMTRVLHVEGPIGTHLRGAAFTEYRNTHWTPGLEPREMSTQGIARLWPLAQGQGATITRLQDDLSLLFLPLNCAGIRPTRVQEVERDAVDPALVKVAAPAPYAYEVWLTPVPEHQGPLCPLLESHQRGELLVLPPEMADELRAMAAGIVDEEAGPRARIEAVHAYLQANHSYSLRGKFDRGMDPLLDFLRNKKPAHCEFFASAATLLLRAAGVPTRYVVGYYVHESAGTNEWTVRQADAHAWAECWIDGTGWVTVDATPGGGLPDRMRPSAAWYRLLFEWFGDTALFIGDWLAQLSWLQLGGLAAGLVALVVIPLWLRDLWARRRTRVAVRIDYADTAARWVALSARYQALLARLGIPCPAHVTWREHLARARLPGGAGDPTGGTPTRRGLPLAALDALVRFARAYDAARFGRPEDDAAAAELERTLEHLEKETA